MRNRTQRDAPILSNRVALAFDTRSLDSGFFVEGRAASCGELQCNWNGRPAPIARPLCWAVGPFAVPLAFKSAASNSDHLSSRTFSAPLLALLH